MSPVSDCTGAGMSSSKPFRAPGAAEREREREKERERRRERVRVRECVDSPIGRRGEDKDIVARMRLA
jgi:hypothetical protein